MEHDMEIHDDHIHLRPHLPPPAAPEPHALAPVLEQGRKHKVIPGFREHPPLPEKFRIGPYGDYTYAMKIEETNDFLQLFKNENFPLGLEIDYIAGFEDETASIVNDMLDRASELGVGISGLHGSVHLLPGDVRDVEWPKGDVHHVIWDLDEAVFIEHVKDRGPKRFIYDYFGAMLDMIDIGNFDCLSHLEVVRKFDRKNTAGESIYFYDCEEIYNKLARNILEELSGTGKAIEINTAGIFSPIGRPYISQDLLGYAVELGIPVSYGSDAHTPSKIGAHFNTATKMLEAAGRDYLVTFENRKMVKYSF
jgi:HisJ family histidinol phosphate phosphatase